MLEARTAKIETAKHLRERCLSREHCFVLLKGGTVSDSIKANIKELIEKFPSVQFAHVDSELLELSLEKKMAPFEASEHRMVMFRRTDGAVDVPPEGHEESLKTSARSYKVRNRT